MRNLQIFDCEQYSPAWWSVRLGMPTASNFDTVQAQGRKGESSVTRKRYIYRLAGERYRQAVCEEEQITSPAMERGLLMEEEAVQVYEISQGVETMKIGFYRDDDVRAGCSPDRLVVGSGLFSIRQPNHLF